MKEGREKKRAAADTKVGQGFISFFPKTHCRRRRGKKRGRGPKYKARERSTTSFFCFLLEGKEEKEERGMRQRRAQHLDELNTFIREAEREREGGEQRCPYGRARSSQQKKLIKKEKGGKRGDVGHYRPLQPIYPAWSQWGERGGKGEKGRRIIRLEIQRLSPARSPLFSGYDRPHKGKRKGETYREATWKLARSASSPPSEETEEKSPIPRSSTERIVVTYPQARIKKDRRTADIEPKRTTTLEKKERTGCEADQKLAASKWLLREKRER